MYGQRGHTPQDTLRVASLARRTLAPHPAPHLPLSLAATPLSLALSLAQPRALHSSQASATALVDLEVTHGSTLAPAGYSRLTTSALGPASIKSGDHSASLWRKLGAETSDRIVELRVVYADEELPDASWQRTKKALTTAGSTHVVHLAFKREPDAPDERAISHLWLMEDDGEPAAEDDGFTARLGAQASDFVKLGERSLGGPGTAIHIWYRRGVMRVAAAVKKKSTGPFNQRTLKVGDWCDADISR